MKRRRKESPAMPAGYMNALSKLFARSPAEIEAQQGPIPAPQSTQAAPAVSMSKSVKGARHGK
jgi:hypothetical protein